ncbi:BQ2448_5441 [Microbotryum intermedium]|uniref:BQ2448_5441 protein n=1 Tax=Microbotryum intermedium TaxID=269621 RepID=A0A238F0Z6_9BASI|nr:BQ2448_5441 [Microbotryum intermedium]
MVRSPRRDDDDDDLSRPPYVIRINRLTKNVHRSHLDHIFSPYGKILDIDLPLERRLGTHRGTAWITYATLAQADKAVDCMDLGQIDGSEVTVVLEKAIKPPPPPPATRGGGSYGNGGGGARWGQSTTFPTGSEKVMESKSREGLQEGEELVEKCVEE